MPCSEAVKIRMEIPVNTALHADGHRFVDTGGTIFKPRGASAFRLYQRWLRGENVGPFCDYLAGLTDGMIVRTYRRLFDPEFGSIRDLS